MAPENGRFGKNRTIPFFLNPAKMKVLSIAILVAIAAVAVQAKKKGPKITNKARVSLRAPK